jgi:hypothetical protein
MESARTPPTWRATVDEMWSAVYRGYADGSRLSVEVRKTTNQMVTQDEHRFYPGSGRELRNTLRPVSLWVVLICDDDVF